MLRRLAFAFIWFCFIAYAFLYAPPPHPDTLDTLVRLSTGQWQGLNPAVVSLFNLMGIWPMIYACLALIDGIGKKIPAWPFVAASFGVGAFALLPYLALREENSPAADRALAQSVTQEKPNPLLALIDSPWTGRLLTIGTLGLLGYGLLYGDWSDFVAQWRTSAFIHVMSLDFCMLSVLVAPLVRSDMNRRHLNQSGFFWSGLFWVAALVPLLGVLLYLSVRSPLVQAQPRMAQGR